MKVPIKQSARVDVFDPKGEISPFLIDDTEARVFEHSRASDAAYAALKAMQQQGELGILVLEEMMTVTPSEYQDITTVCAIRRRSTSGEGLAVYATTQRPKIMPVALRSTADLWVVGKITDTDDLKAIESVAGPDFAKDLPNLEIGEFLGYDFGKELTL
jgi:hypothetical protein